MTDERHRWRRPGTIPAVLAFVLAIPGMIFVTFIGLWVGLEGGGVYAARAAFAWTVATSPMAALLASIVTRRAGLRSALIAWAAALLIAESITLRDAWVFVLAPAALTSALAAWRIVRDAGSERPWRALTAGGLAAIACGAGVAAMWVLWSA